METIKTLNPLLDLDPTVYAAGFAADAEVRKGFMEKGMGREEADNARLETDYLSHALSNAKTAVEFVLNDAFPEREYHKAYLTGKGNFRYEIATIKPYKGNRDPLHRPKYYKDIREFLIGKYQAEVVEGQEADDALAQAQWSKPDKSTVICSIDKDLMMIPGYHFNPKKGTFWYQSIKDAELFFLWQMMVGDTTDNIPGVTGVGPKTADKIMAECGEDYSKVLERVQQLYQKEFGANWRQAFDEIGQLLWMRRKEGEGPSV